jgi:surface antigen
LKTYDNKIFYVLSIGIIVAFWIQTEVLADPFGTPLGSYKGTVAYSNGTTTDVGKESSDCGTKWQCVEYVHRFYYTVMCMPQTPRHWEFVQRAADYWDTCRDKGLEPHENGKVAPQLDDILVWGTSVGGGNGHVAIVSEVRDDRVSVIEQNVRNSRGEWKSQSVSRYIKREGNRLSPFPDDPIQVSPEGLLRVSDGHGTLSSENGTLSEGDEKLPNGWFFDRYSFEGVAGQTATISMTSDEINTYLMLCFIRPDGGIERAVNDIAVNDNDDCGCGTNARISLKLPKTGTYLIVATSLVDVGRTGRYTISRRLETPNQPNPPDLTPYKPSGWSDKIVVSKRTGTNTDDPDLTTDDTLYVDWAVINQGGDINNRFYYHLYVDTNVVWFQSDSLKAGSLPAVQDHSIGKLGAGTHTIKIVADPTNVINESNESNNEYSKTISISQRGDQFEVDDTINQAKMIATDGSKQSHTFHKAGDIDWIKFPAAIGMGKYTIETSNLRNNCDTVIDLCDQFGNLIQQDDDGGVENRASKISDWQPKVTGMYFIKVWEYSGNAGGSYEISIKESQVQERGDQFEVDDTINQAKMIATDGSKQSHTFHKAGDIDWIKFPAAIGMGKYTIETSNLRNNCDTVIDLCDQFGNLIQQDDDGGVENRASKISDWQPKVTGMYFIKVWEYGGIAGGSYEISIKESQFQEREDQFEVDDTINQAKMIATDGSKQSHTFHKAGDIDWIKFPAMNISKYTIETSNLRNCDTIIALYNINGNFIQQDNDGGINRASKISDWRPTFGGMYFIKVWECNGNAGGSYEISIKSEVIPAAPMLPERTFVGPNYPNPLNPETWIPFQLAESARVTLTIYDATGKRIRLLDLGYMPLGYYTTRGRAAYWDGRNDEGERVSSGVYFYELSAGNFKSVKKMVILK